MDKLNPDDSRPPFRQIADALRASISDGTYAVGDKLPGHAQVAEEYGVSIGTVKRAYADLQHDRLIVTRQGQGSYVRAGAVDAAPAGEGETADLRRTVEALVARVEVIERQLGDSQV